MKLYTREQMIKAFEYGRTLKDFDWIGDMIDSLIPIKLPTEKQIEQEAVGHSTFSPSYIEGAKYVIDYIKKQEQ